MYDWAFHGLQGFVAGWVRNRHENPDVFYLLDSWEIYKSTFLTKFISENNYFSLNVIYTST